MDIFWMLFLLLFGFLLLVKGADLFVDGACGLSARLKIPAYLVGVTVVAFGTSLPEAAVSITASIAGDNAIALGNVVGSNVFNTLMVLGVSALFTALPVGRATLRRDFPLCIGATALLLVQLLLPSPAKPVLGRLDGALLLVLFALFLFFSIRAGKKEAISSAAYQTQKDAPAAGAEGAPDASMKYWKIFLLIVIGIAGVILGGQMTVEGATRLAAMVGMSDAVIGLTVVAIGTSLPELVTSIVAARKKQAEIAVGNAIGSNLFNVLFILGASAAISPISSVGSPFILWDVGFLLGILLLTFLFALPKKQLRLPAGIAMVALYAAYTAFLLLREQGFLWMNA